MRADYIRDLMRARDIPGLANNKSKLLEAVEKALTDRVLPWYRLIEFLDRHEPFGKQRVFLLEAREDTEDQWTAEALEAAADDAGLTELWNAPTTVAAPEELTLSSVGVNDGKFTVLAIGRRTYRRRAEEYEDEVELPKERMEVHLYEFVDIRGWVRLELDLATGAAEIRAVSLPQQEAQQAVFEEFRDLLDGWFPLDAFDSLNLAKTIKALHEDERINTPHEARVQAVGYDDPSGLKSTIRSSSSGQSVSGQGSAMDIAIDAIRGSGNGADGNFYFLPPNEGGVAGTPLSKSVRVVVYAATGRIDFPKPSDAAELRHVLQRVRLLAA